jgi:hypothetical protein
VSFIIDIMQEFRWRPKIGDPSFMGWFTVVAYGVAALLAGGVYLRRKDRIWIAVAVGLAVLCINKELDLQSLFTDIGRVASRHLGVYEQRRHYQKWFVLGTVAGAGIFAAWFMIRHYRFWFRYKLLSSGLMFLMTFIVVRAISFHHFDMFLKSSLFGVRMNWALELGGIFLVTLAAVAELAKPAKLK